MEKTQRKVPFDLGISNYYPSQIGAGTISHLESIYKLKSNNQKKYQLTILENSLISPIKTIAAIYYGCVVYGSIIHSKYKNPPAIITANPMLNMSESEKKQLDLTTETLLVKELYEKMDKAVSFVLKRGSKLPANFNYCADLYVSFVTINNNFIDIEQTDQLKVPDKLKHFQTYSEDNLETLENRFKDAVDTGNLDIIFDIT